MLDFYGELDTAILLHQSIADRTKASRASLAMSCVDQYSSAAAIQQERIWNGLAAARSAALSWENRQPAHKQLFVDIHFYVICWVTIQNMIKVVNEASDFALSQQVYESYRDNLEHYRNLRNHLEHINERFPGGKKVQVLSSPGDLGNLVNDHYTFGGESWDLGPNSLVLLQQIVTEWSSTVRSEALALLQARQVP